jgi:hypothetical protein
MVGVDFWLGWFYIIEKMIKYIYLSYLVYGFHTWNMACINNQCLISFLSI